MSKGGRSIIALHSTTRTSLHLRLLQILPPAVRYHQPLRCQLYCHRVRRGAASRSNARERAKRLIAIAHPKFREELAEEFEKRFGEKLKV
ncbi:MAG: acetyl-CoA hydrolase/transferase C-terminal domain-containing protein [Butyricicoccus sp.]